MTGQQTCPLYIEIMLTCLTASSDVSENTTDSRYLSIYEITVTLLVLDMHVCKVDRTTGETSPTLFQAVLWVLLNRL